MKMNFTVTLNSAINLVNILKSLNKTDEEILELIDDRIKWGFRDTDELKSWKCQRCNKYFALDNKIENILEKFYYHINSNVCKLRINLRPD